jgi:transposase
MSGISKVISESLYNKAIDALKEVARSGDVSRKLQAIKSAKEHGISVVASVFDISRVSLMSWIKAFSKSGIDGLKLQEGRGRKHILSDIEIEQVKKWYDSDSNLTIKATKLKIEELFSKKLSMGATHNLIKKKLGLSYITPRPSHYKKDESSHEEFKKKSSRETRGRSD